jgi:outer membrane lipoprotein SlyB
MTFAQLVRAIFMTPNGLATLAGVVVLAFVGNRVDGSTGEQVAIAFGTLVVLSVAIRQVRRGN